MTTPYQSRANLGQDCPYCGKRVEWYDLKIRMIFHDFVRERATEEYELSCGCVLPFGVEVHDEYIDETAREGWFFDPLTEKTLLCWVDRQSESDIIG